MRNYPTLRPLFLLLVLVIGLLGCGSELPGPPQGAPALPAAAAGGPMIRLVYADTANTGCSSCLVARGFIELRNVHPTKQVTVVYSPNGGPFVESAASFVGMIDAGREIWGFTVPATGHVRFALRYRVAGNEHWDNNNGRDYEVDGPLLTPAVGEGRDIALNWASVASLDAGEVDLYFFVRDRAFQKQVQVVYSSDDWATTQTAPAHYVGTYGGMQRWQVSAPFRKDAGRLSLALVERQAGGEQWDNNYGRNFSCVRCQSRSCQRWICQGLTIPQS